MRRDHVASTLIRRHFDVVCLLGCLVVFQPCSQPPVRYLDNVSSYLLCSINSGERYRQLNQRCNFSKRTFRHMHPAQIDTDQPVHLRIRIFTERILDSWRCKNLAENEDFDQTTQQRRLIWVFVGRTCQKVRFLTPAKEDMRNKQWNKMTHMKPPAPNKEMHKKNHLGKVSRKKKKETRNVSLWHRCPRPGPSSTTCRYFAINEVEKRDKSIF